MNLQAYFEALSKTVKAGGPEPELTLRVLSPGRLFEAQCSRKKVVSTDVEGALLGLLVALGGTVPAS